MNAILNFIWGLLGPSIVSLAINVGLPEAVKWLMAKGLPKRIVDGLVSIVQGALEQISAIKKDPTLSDADKKVQVRAVREQAKLDAKKHCTGVGCPIDTKGI